MNHIERHRWISLVVWFAAFACVVALAWPATAAGQASARLTAADRADIRAFTFNDDVFARLQAVVTQARAMHIKRSHLDMSRVHSLHDMAAQMVAADPRIKALLAKHGFTPRQFLVANMALLGTVVPLERSQGTAREAKVKAQLTPANVRYYEAHKAAMDKLVHPGGTGGSTH